MPTVRSHLDEARERIIAGDLDHARTLCGEVLARFPRHVEAHTLLAEARREAGEYDEARRLFLQVLSADPESTVGYWALGLIAEQQGERDTALGLLERALEYNPGDPDLYRALHRFNVTRPSTSRGGLARLSQRQGLFHRALVEYEAAVRGEPDRLDLRLGYTEALWRLERYADCVSHCEEILQDAPDCLKAGLLLADCYRRQGRMSDVHHLLQTAATLDPDGTMAAVLFADSDPPWVQPPPVTLDAAENGHAAEPIPPTLPEKQASDWLDQIVRSVDARPAVPEPVEEEPVGPVGGWVQVTPAEPTPVAASVGVDADPPLEDDPLDKWSDLLTLDVAPDPAAQARLEAALAELADVDASAPNSWTQVDAGQSGLTAALGRLQPTGGEPAAVATTVSGSGAPPSRPDATNKVAETMPVGAPNDEIDAVREKPLEESSDPVDTTINGGPEYVTPADREPVAAFGDVRDHVVETESTSSSETVNGWTVPVGDSPDDLGTGAPPSESAEGQGDLDRRLSAARDLQQQGEHDAAVDEYKKLIREAPHLIDQIVDNLRWIVYANPNHAQAHRALGDAYMRCGRFQQAIDEYNWVLVNKRSPLK